MSKINDILNKTRSPKVHLTLGKAFLYSSIITVMGLLSGFAIKLFDIYTSLLGNIFSGISVWVLICTVIAVFSSTPKRACINVFLYCVGMIAAYYGSAELLKAYYSMTFVYGWCAFTVITPIFAFFAWYGRGKGWLAAAISVIVIIFMIVSAWILFGIRIYDLIFATLTGAVLLIGKGK